MADDRYLAIVEMIIRRLEEGVDPWVPPWDSEVGGEFLAGVRPLRNGISIRIRRHFLKGRTCAGRMACAPGPGFAGSGRCALPRDPLAVGLHRLPRI